MLNPGTPQSIACSSDLSSPARSSSSRVEASCLDIQSGLRHDVLMIRHRQDRHDLRLSRPRQSPRLPATARYPAGSPELEHSSGLPPPPHPFQIILSAPPHLAHHLKRNERRPPSTSRQTYLLFNLQHSRLLTLSVHQSINRIVLKVNKSDIPTEEHLRR